MHKKNQNKNDGYLFWKTKLAFFKKASYLKNVIKLNIC